MKKLFKSVANAWGKFKKAWKAETPKFWKWVIGASATTVAVVLAVSNIAIPGVETPEWFTQNAWNIIGGATALGVLAKTMVKKPTNKKSRK